MNFKKFAYIFGGFYILLALASVYPNDIIGHNAFLSTDFLHNFIHLLIGFVLVGIALWDNDEHFSLPRVIRTIGGVLIVLAVFGAWFTGLDIGKIMGLITVNGTANILHLITGVLCIVVGTSPLRNYRKGDGVMHSH
ncbi:MAG: hypothetical protein JWP09_897 [Candidatus Taylorbacteria bacterium]|nr:hypothetical protein [Candidatus Taylorbacteria bacterium]